MYYITSGDIFNKILYLRPVVFKMHAKLNEKRHISLIFCSLFVYFIAARLCRYVVLLCRYFAFGFYEKTICKKRKASP